MRKLKLLFAGFALLGGLSANAQTDVTMKTAYREMLQGAEAHPDRWEWYAIWMIDRKDGAHVGELSFKGLVLDTSSCTASVNGTDLPLTVMEYAILSLMLSNPKKLFSKANIYESIWNEPYYDDDRTVKVHMSNIRTKLSKLDPDNEYIETVWGMGYRLMN